MKILNTLRLLPIFIILVFQPPNTNEVLTGQTMKPLQPLTAYPFNPPPNVALSDFVSAFVSTASQELNDKSVALPLYQLQKTAEEIQHGYFNQSYNSAVYFGEADPASLATKVLWLTKSFESNKNYELEVFAGTYAIGQFLENQGLFPDITTAVEKAHEFVNIIESRANELPPNHSWADYYSSLAMGTLLFLKRNGLKSYKDYRFIGKLFFKQLPKAMSL